MRIDIPQWILDLLWSVNAWRGQWLYWEMWLFGAHIFTFVIPPFDVLPGAWTIAGLNSLKDSANNLFAQVESFLGTLEAWRAFLWDQITGWISQRIADLEWWRGWLIDRANEAMSNIGRLWNEANAVWNKITSGINAWWSGTWAWLSAWIIARATDAINTVWGWLEPLRTWWDQYHDIILSLLFNPWQFLWDKVIGPLLGTIAATFSPLQPVLDFYNVVHNELETIVRDPGQWVYLQLERFITRNAERVRRAVTTFLELIW